MDTTQLSVHAADAAAGAAQDPIRPAAREPLNCMLDTETLGVKPFCPVLSIGACIVDMTTDPDTAAPIDLIKDPFYVAIDLQSCLDVGLKVDADTLRWWMEQKPEAIQAAFNDPQRVSLPVALDAFTTWVNSRPLKMWGNSARFDLGIIEAAYTAIGKQAPWEFRNERCYRTVKGLPEARGIECPRYGTHHNALDDAISQALHLAAINKRLCLHL
jgi:hypothetical protein